MNECVILQTVLLPK